MCCGLFHYISNGDLFSQPITSHKEIRKIMLKVILLRHGETTYNADGNRYCGRTDIGLTEKGLTQAAKVYEALQKVPVDAIYASPLERARKTAEIASGNRLVTTDERIIEADFGLWEGKTKEEFNAENPELWQRWMNDPQTTRAGGTGETGGEIVKRVNSFFEDMLARHNNQTIMVVAHNGINRLYMAYGLGMPLSNYRRLEQENSSITLFELDEGNVFTLKKLNANAI
jgi:alpha-ribazole phosphatase/probable phosphoglycerate mutase